MKTIKIKVLKFEELKPEVQKKVIENNRYFNVEDSDWDKWILEEETENLNKKGFENAVIHYSGFYSQGDGACFTANVNIMKVLKHLKLLSKCKNICKKSITIKIIKSSSMYHHENTMDIDYFDYEDIKILKEYELISEQILQYAKNKAIKIYNNLEKSYCDLISDEQIKESLIINEYDFLEDGTRWI